MQYLDYPETLLRSKGKKKPSFKSGIKNTKKPHTKNTSYDRDTKHNEIIQRDIKQAEETADDDYEFAMFCEEMEIMRWEKRLFVVDDRDDDGVYLDYGSYRPYPYHTNLNSFGLYEPVSAGRPVSAARPSPGYANDYGMFDSSDDDLSDLDSIKQSSYVPPPKKVSCPYCHNTFCT